MTDVNHPKHNVFPRPDSAASVVHMFALICDELPAVAGSLTFADRVSLANPEVLGMPVNILGSDTELMSPD